MSGKTRFADARVAALKDLLVEVQEAGVHTRRRDGTTVWSDPCRRLVAELWIYAFPVLQALLRDGQMEVRIRKLGISGLPFVDYDEQEAILRTEEHRQELAAEMFHRALPRFLTRTVEKRRFDATRSSVATHFVNGCVWAYPEALRVWLKSRRQLMASAHESWPDQERKNAFATIEHGDLIQNLVAKVPAKTRVVLNMVAHGYTNSEIAAELHLTPSAIRDRIYHFRKDFVLPLVRSGAVIPPRGHTLQYLGPTEEDEWW